MIRNTFPTLLPFFVVFIAVIARRPVRILRERGAVSPESAVPLDDLSAGDRRRLERLVARESIRQTATGAYYYDAERERQLRTARVPWLVGLAVVLIVGVVLLSRLITAKV